jgi:N-acetylmuramoyl-L-alanine amidase
VSKILSLLSLVVLLLAGCSSMPPRVNPTEPLPPDWDSELGPMHEIETPLPPRTNETPVVVQPVVPKPVQPAPATLTTAETGMISLNRWAAQNGYGALRMVPLQPVSAYSVNMPNGNIVVQPGKLAAYWNRMDVRLGFVPQLFGGQIFLHALDIKKIVEPLAHGVSVSTPADRLIVIDPGHGGSNLGTRNIVTGQHEKEYTLDWARRLAPLLQQSGWRVALTRTNDITMSLAERVAFAEKLDADFFLSLHFNATGDGSQSAAGLETYCLTPTGMPSSLTRGYTDDARLVFPNNAFDTDNLRYAVRLHRSLLQVNGQRDRGVRHARFLDVLQGHNCPAVLVEAGFLSNPDEARKVADPEYRQKLAEAVAKALE